MEVGYGDRHRDSSADLGTVWEVEIGTFMGLHFMVGHEEEKRVRRESQISSLGDHMVLLTDRTNRWGGY